jgi:UDP-glucose 4-epimerase
MPQNILVTGGAGYIGSHTCVSLLEAGHRVVVVDNLDNSSEESLRRVQQIAGRPLEFHRVDLLDASALDKIFASTAIDAVIHFAGLKAVGESVAKPLRYYYNNLAGTVNLLQMMGAHGVKNLIFSSSATVYGDPQQVPITEDMPLGAVNPYGRTKLYIEEMCRDLCRAEPEWKIVLLRYFNPIGAHSSGRIGEDPRGIPNNLMPYVLQVAVGRRPLVSVFGNDYPTPDGTGIRDYIHVVDLAEGHLAALNSISGVQGCIAVNLGTGQGCSVMQVIEAASRAIGKPIPYQFAPRRPGDAAICYADAALARKLFGWEARRGLDEMCADSWRWQSANPQGYATD